MTGTHVEIPAKNFPKGVGPGSFDLEMLRWFAEHANRLYETGHYALAALGLNVKPWVLLTLLDAWDELQEYKQTDEAKQRTYLPGEVRL